MPLPRSPQGPSRRAIDAAALAAIVQHYPGLGEFRRITRNALSVNAPTCLFETDRGTYFAKQAEDGDAARDEARWAHLIANHARAKGFPTPLVHATRAGETLATHDGRAYALFDRARGEDRYGDRPVFAPFDDPAEARAAGEALARFHQATADLAVPPRQASPHALNARYEAPIAPAPRQAIAALLAADPSTEAYLSECTDAFEAVVARTLAVAAPIRELASGLPRGVIHGDFIKRNLFWQGLAIAEVIDFDLWNAGFWAYDLALALLPCGFDWPALLAGQGQPNRLQLAALLAGYQSVRALEPAERAALPALVETARFEFYVSGISLAIARGDRALAKRFFGLLTGTSAYFAAHPTWREALG